MKKRFREEQIIAVLKEQGAGAKTSDVCLSTVTAYVKRWMTTGSIDPDKFGGHKKRKLAAHTDKVKELLKAEPDQTVAKLQIRPE